MLRQGGGGSKNIEREKVGNKEHVKENNINIGNNRYGNRIIQCTNNKWNDKRGKKRKEHKSRNKGMEWLEQQGTDMKKLEKEQEGGVRNRGGGRDKGKKQVNKEARRGCCKEGGKDVGTEKRVGTWNRNNKV